LFFILPTNLFMFTRTKLTDWRYWATFVSMFHIWVNRKLIKINLHCFCYHMRPSVLRTNLDVLYFFDWSRGSGYYFAYRWVSSWSEFKLSIGPDFGLMIWEWIGICWINVAIFPTIIWLHEALLLKLIKNECQTNTSFYLPNTLASISNDLPF